MNDVVRLSHLPPMPPADSFRHSLYADACDIYWNDSRIINLSQAVYIAASCMTASAVEANLPLAAELITPTTAQAPFKPHQLSLLRPHVTNDDRLAPDARSASAIRGIFMTTPWPTQIAHNIGRREFDAADFNYTGKLRKRPVSVALEREFARRRLLLENGVPLVHPVRQMPQ